jgi:putative oxidoreductase
MKKLLALFAKAYGWLIRGADWLKSPFLLIIRLYWGWQTFVSGHSHLMIVPTMIERFREWHVPYPELNVYISGYTEEVFGLLLLVGLASRITAIPLICNFCVAYLTASHDTLVNIFNKPDDFVSDPAFLFLLASLIVFIFGPGAF